MYGSLLNSAHLQAVKSQVSVVYQTLEGEPILISPQSQGSTVLCGFFAIIASALTLLKKGDPSTLYFKTDQMRNHLHKCLITGEVDSFPQTAVAAKKPVVDTITSYLKDQKRKQTTKQALKKDQNHVSDFNSLSRKVDKQNYAGFKDRVKSTGKDKEGEKAKQRV